jgi:hypothetical protein
MSANLGAQPTNVDAVEPTRTAESPQKLSYEPPTATFVPLKLEERLLACDQADKACNVIEKA